MESSHLLAPTYTGQNFSFSSGALAPNTLTPYSLAKPISSYYEPSDEEKEIISVGLFVEILNHEFRNHKGYASSDWRTLFKYWAKHIYKGKFWSAQQEIRKINVRKLVKEGVLTVETQKRLYGDEAWYPNFIENERERTIEWLKTLDPEDIEYTLYQYYEGGLQRVNEEIKRKQRPQTAKVELKKSSKTNTQIVRDPLILELSISLFKERKGYSSKNEVLLAKFTTQEIMNSRLEFEVAKFLKIKNNNLAPKDSSEKRTVDDYVYEFSKYDEEDYIESFRDYFRQLAEKKGSAKREKKPKEVKYHKLMDSTLKILYEESSYSDIPPEFENINQISEYFKPIFAFLDEFYSDKPYAFEFPSEEFISFCLLRKFPYNVYGSRSQSTLRKSNPLIPMKALESFTPESRPLAESEVRMHINHFSSQKMIFIRVNLVFKAFNNYQTTEGQTLYTFWEKISPFDKSRLCLWLFEYSPSELLAGPEHQKLRLKQRGSIFDQFYNSLKQAKLDKVNEANEKKEILAKKLKEKYANVKRKDLAESSQSRWALGKKLLEIEKKFPLDPVVKNMIKVEFTENPLKRYDLEYETHNPDEELKRKQGKVSIESFKMPQGAKLSAEEVLKLQSNRLKYIEEHGAKTEQQILDEKTKQQEPSMFKAIKQLAKSYIEFKKNSQGSISAYLSNGYYSLKSQFPLAVSKNFPYKNYGAARIKDALGRRTSLTTFNRSFPLQFKHHFFAVFKSLIKTPKGIIMLKSMPPLFWAPPSKAKCTIHYKDCPPNCLYVTLNKRVIRQTLKAEPCSVSWHAKLRPFYRPDMVEEKEKIFMNYSDARECIFEPIVGSKVPEKHLALAFKQFSEVRNKIDPDQAPNFNMWVNRLGNNLKTMDSGLYKTGVYKRAKVLVSQEKYKQAKALLYENFNMASILDYFDPGKNRPKKSELPAEDFNKPQNLDVNRQVFGLFCAIKMHYKHAKEQRIAVENLKKRDERMKMCTVKDCVRTGCVYAHSEEELKARKEENAARTNYKLKLKERFKTIMSQKYEPEEKRVEYTANTIGPTLMQSNFK